MNKGKLEHSWSLLCSGISTDRQTNNATIFNIIDQIKTPKSYLGSIKAIDGKDKPVVPIELNFVTLWRKTTPGIHAEAEVEIEMFDPSGEMLQKASYSLSVEKDKERLRSTVTWPAIRVNDSGRYVFHVGLKEKGAKAFRVVHKVYLGVEVLDD